MKGFLKKIIAIMCAIALTVAGINAEGINIGGIFAVAADSVVVKATEDNVLTLGKTFLKNDNITFSYANSGVEINFTGTSIAATFTMGQDSASPQVIAVFVDGNENPEDATFITLSADGQYTLASGLVEGEHTVTIRKTARSYYGFLAVATVSIQNIILDPGARLLAKSPKKDIVIEAFGDSITNGDALIDNGNGTSSSYSWAGYIGEVARYFDAELRSCGISGQGLLRSILSDENGIYFNLFPPTNNWAKLDESVGLEGQVSYDHKANPADVVIINLGTNDNAAFTAGQISSNEFYTEYLRFINEIHSDCPDAIVVGALGAMGADGLFSAIQNAVNDANAQAGYTYAYFTKLENCNNITNGKGYDNSHPSSKAHKIYGQQISEVIEKALIAKGVMNTEEHQKATVIAARESSSDYYDRTGKYAADGDFGTRWASTQHGSSEWVEFEFDRPYEINRIHLSWEVAYASKYEVQVSMDGVSWTTDTVFNYGNGGLEWKKLNGSKAKYVRILCNERGTIHAYSLYEVEIYGKALPEEKESELTATTVVGEMFMPVSASPSGATVLINNSGMSGIEAPNHMHASFDSNDSTSNGMISSNMYRGDKSDIVIDLGQRQALGQMYIWNYNDIRHTDYCMKEIKVSYSQDGTNYIVLGVFTLGQSSVSDNNEYGGNVACSVDSGHSVDFKGITGRYVKITPISNYGGSYYGLSEVRIFRHKTEPIAGDSLTVDAFSPNQIKNTTTINSFNNSGLSIIDDCEKDSPVHSSNLADMSVLIGKSSESIIVLNLDGNYPLSSIKLWNYNFPGGLDFGIKEFEVYYTVDTACAIVTHSNEQLAAGAKDYIDFNQGNWKKLGTYTLPRGTGFDGLKAQLTIDASGIRAQHIKIVPISNYDGGNDIFGLSEVKVYVDGGWATEYEREWTGVLSSSGTFAYQGNSVADNKGSSLLNNNNGRGWIGGDGFHTTSVNGSQLQGTVNDSSKTIFTFQDSFEGNFGNYDGFGYKHGYGTVDGSGFSIGMRNHAYMMLEGDEPDVRNIQMYMQLKNGMSEANGYGGNIYPGKYWLGDSTVVDGVLYTVANQFIGLTVPDADFYASPLTDNGFPSMTTIPSLVYRDITVNTQAVYHESVYEEGDYIYSYGKKDNLLVVSRTLKQNYPTLTGFTYWNGSTWVGDPNQAAAISNFMPGNEFNITKITSGTFEGKYMLIHTSFSITGAVCYAISDSPTGPFVSPSDNEIYWSTEKYKWAMRYYPDYEIVYDQWNYNAKSQPAISQDGELLITYHFGVHDSQADRVPTWGYFNAVMKEAEHPTFIKMFDIPKEKEVIEVPDTVNLALNKTATASSVEAEERPASMAVDGDASTRWASLTEDPSWIMVDLGETKNVCKVVLSWEAAYSGNYIIQVSDDGKNWTRAIAVTDGDGGIDELTFPTVSGRYIRMYGVTRATFFGYSLYEFEVYGPAAEQPEPPTEAPTEAPTEPPTTTSNSGTDIELVEVFGLVVDNPESGVISVVWGNPGNGQLYNVYVDGVLAVSSTGAKLSNVACGYYTIPSTEGAHTVKVTGTANGIETAGASLSVTVTGSSSVETSTVEEGKLDGFVTAAGNWNDLAYWSVYFASGWGNNPTGRYKDGGSYDNFGVYVDSASLAEWGIQLKTNTLAVEAGKTYTCTVVVDFNKDMTSSIRFKDEMTQTEVLYTPVAGTNTFVLEFTPTTNEAQIFFDLGMLPMASLFEITSFELKTDEEESEIVTINGGIELNGYQISTSVDGYRTIYSVDSHINGKEVVESGIVYALSDFADTNKLYVGSDDEYVRSFTSTSEGISSYKYSESDIATSYVMTMLFAVGTPQEYTANWTIKAYAKLSDGTYVYTDTFSYSYFEIADNLYQNGIMGTKVKHDYLYNNILTVVNPEYIIKEFNWLETIV